MKSDKNVLFVDTSKIQIVIDRYKKEKEVLTDLLNEYLYNIKFIPNYWKGNNGEEAYTRLDKYSRRFTPLINRLNKNITFLENVVRQYEDFDEKSKKKLEEYLNN